MTRPPIADGLHRRAQPGRTRALAVLGAVAVLLVGGTVADLLAAAEPPPPPPPVEQGAAAAGSWYCPAVAGEGETARLTVAAVGEQPSTVIVERYAKGRPVADATRTVEPGAPAVVDLSGDDATAPVAVRWTGGAAVASWRVNGQRPASAPCEPGPAQRWHVVGFDTNRGLTSTLHVFNPFSDDAVIRLVFARPEGPKELVLADNILIDGGGTTSLNLRRYQPEEEDLGVIVEVLSGRVVVQGEQTIVPPPRTTGASGRLLLAGAPAPAENWYFDMAADGEGTESWLSVLNPDDDLAAVEVRVSNPRSDATALLAEVSVPPGGVSRVELAGASKDPGFGVSVSVVNGRPVVVSRSTALTTEGRRGVSGGLGAAALSTRWALVGGGTREGEGVISLYNPGATKATVSVTAAGAPAAWDAIALPPNGRATLLLSDAGGDRRSLPVTVTSDVPIVAGLRTTTDGGDELGLDLDVGVAAQVWLGPPTRPAVRRNPSLSTSSGETPPSEPPILDQVDEVDQVDQAPAADPS